MELTLEETLGQLHEALRDYIEATYHISNPALVEQRREPAQSRRKHSSTTLSGKHPTVPDR